jgi:ATP-dependent RNA helicase SUPV3L1/SUV3
MREPTLINALLGPTNTGKTHRAVERMLEHATGMIGLPLRLLAREVYDRVSTRVGEGRVALMTGEEKRIPPRPDYWVCTVEAMPLDLPVDFLAVDEIQLAAHPQRGHVFTDRLLHARGEKETWFLGSDTATAVLSELVPTAKVSGAPRFSKLSAAETVPLARVPRRSAVVAFSMEQVYELAERLRVLRGGTAVVLGALSPRARNAQVAMFQSGEVDYLVATDAIGMGLNLDVRHVAFASLRKFDGRVARELDAAELGQIAGRAGRHLQDGTFSALSPHVIPSEVRAQIESQRFAPLRKVVWRSSELDFGSVASLTASLKSPAPRRILTRVHPAEDEAALAALLQRSDVRDRATTEARVALLWEVCTVPDFRRLLFEDHVAQLASVFVELCDHGRLRTDFVRAGVTPLEDLTGDVDTLVARIASVRTWTYLANRPSWLDAASRWQEHTRALEDQLSDALHARLVQRFVDEPAPKANAAPRPRRRLTEAETKPVDPRHPFAALKGLRAALAPKEPDTTTSPTAWMESLVDAPHSRFALNERAQVVLVPEGDVLARLVAGTSVTLPDVHLETSASLAALGGGARARLLRRLVAWSRDEVSALLEPVTAAAGSAVDAAWWRGLHHQLAQGLGCALTAEVDGVLSDPAAVDREALAARGLVLGARVVFARALLAPEAVARRVVLVRVRYGAGVRAPAAGAASMAVEGAVSPRAYLAMGYPVMGGRAVRADVVERIAAACATEDGRRSPFAQWLGCGARETAAVLAAIAPQVSERAPSV